jgi:hypothetical protein
MIHKTCFKCKTSIPITEFYRHPQMADGHLNKCKVCTKVDSRIHRVVNIARVNEYDRDRAKTERRRADHRQRQMEYRRKFPERQVAYNAVARAIASEKLRRPECCHGCGSVARVQAHHENYLEPLNVVWLCQKCHSKHHHVRNALSGDWR